jgi:hypothetical protein
MDGVPTRRLSRLAEELAEAGLPSSGSRLLDDVLVEEVDRALRPAVHERHVPSSGVILDPGSDPLAWTAETELEITSKQVGAQGLEAARPFVDGLSSWLLRRTSGGGDEWLLFDRPAGSERDLVVLADVMEATLVQRHPAGVVRIVGGFGVLRWEGLSWHHAPPVVSWLDAVEADGFKGDPKVVEALLRMAVHDLGSLGIGALLIYRPVASPGPAVEELLPPPPPLRISAAAHLAPLRHALGQIDGAAMFDGEGVLRRLGARLVPSAEAELRVDAMGGTRHTSALRYSFDDPTAIVVIVSEDGPVSIARNGAVVDPAPSPADHMAER